MAEIITDRDVLGVRADELDTTKQNKEMREIIVELKKTIRERNLLGLAAPQIGYSKRVFVVNYSGNLVSYVNPVIYDAKGLTLSRENCPSIPDKQFLRIRNQEITLYYVNPLGKVKSEKFIGAAAIIMQYLCDMLDGILLSDIGMEIDEHWDEFTEDEKNELFDYYLDSIDLKRKQTQEEVNADPGLKQIDDGIKFLTALQKGDVKLAPASVHIDNTEEVNRWLEEKRAEEIETSENGD